MAPNDGERLNAFARTADTSRVEEPVEPERDRGDGATDPGEGELSSCFTEYGVVDDGPGVSTMRIER